MDRETVKRITAVSMVGSVIDSPLRGWAGSTLATSLLYLLGYRVADSIQNRQGVSAEQAQQRVVQIALIAGWFFIAIPAGFPILSFTAMMITSSKFFDFSAITYIVVAVVSAVFGLLLMLSLPKIEPDFNDPDTLRRSLDELVADKAPTPRKNMSPRDAAILCFGLIAIAFMVFKDMT
jgi:hypothetical protein